MRIVSLSPSANSSNGIAAYAGQWQAAMRAQGIDVLTPFASEADMAQKLACIPWAAVDLLHAELGGGGAREFDALARLKRQYPGLVCCATVHDPERLIWRASRLPIGLRWAQTKPRPLPQLAALLDAPRLLRQERQLAHALDSLICLTETGAASLARRMRLPRDQVATLPHGNPVIAPAALPDMPLRLLYFGYFYPGKGIEDLLDALALLLDQKPALRSQLRLTLAGGSRPELAFSRAHDYPNHLRQRLDRLGLSNLVTWQLDLPVIEIPALVQQHHVTVLPYRESRRLALLGQVRGTSGALSWTTACGRGAIVSDARAFTEEVSFGNGQVFPQGDIRALAARLATLSEQPELAAQWASAAQQVAMARQWPHVAAQFKQLFTTLITRPKP